MTEGWIIKNIGDIANFSQGIQVGLKEHESNPKKGYVRFIRIVDYTQNTTDIRYVKDPGKKYFVTEDDIVMVRYGTPGLIGRGKAGVIANNLFKITIIIEGISNDYLSAYLSQDHIQHFLSTQGSATMPALNFTQLKTVVIAYPPIQEQKQIVAILDQAFEAIDQAKANIEKNIANAKELFQSKLNAIFSQKGDGWEEKSLGEIADVNYGYTDKSTSEGDFRYVRITDIDNNGELDKSGKVYIKSTPEALNFILKENDLLMARTGATFAKVLLYKDFEPSVFASYLIKISFNVKVLNELYWYFTKSGLYWEQANYLSSGSAQPHFNGAALKKVIFSYPLDIIKQQELIEIIKGFDITTKEIISNYKQKLKNLEELKKSILQKAFAGELTSPERTQYSKDGRSPSDETQTNKNPERVT